VQARVKQVKRFRNCLAYKTLFEMLKC